MSSWPVMLWAVFLVGLAARLGMLLRHQGYRGIVGNDCGVYYAGSVALLHGRLPYRDFVLVHPPAIEVVLLPFAALTEFMNDWPAFMIANFAFCALGALNAVLVAVVARRFGARQGPAAVAGLFYAAWFCAVVGEFQVKLEPLSNFFLLIGLLLLHRALQRPSRWSAVWAGAALGLTATVKIWWCLPLLIIAIWFLARRRRPVDLIRLVGGMAASALVVIGPFAAAAPDRFVHMVVLDQLGRPRDPHLSARFADMTTVPMLLKRLPDEWIVALAVLFVLAALALCVAALCTAPADWVFPALVLVQLAVLYAAPSWYGYYGDYLGVTLALVVGIVASAGTAWVHVPARAALGVAVSLMVLITVAGTMAITPFHGADQLTRAAAPYRCVMSNSPTVQLRLNALTRGITAGCANAIDVGGGVTGLASGLHSEQQVDRNLLRYLAKGDAAILWNRHQEYIRPTVRQLRTYGVIARYGHHTLYRTR